MTALTFCNQFAIKAHLRLIRKSIVDTKFGVAQFFSEWADKYFWGYEEKSGANF